MVQWQLSHPCSSGRARNFKKIELDSNKENVENYHKIIESLKLAFVDSKTYVTDMDEMKVKIEDLLSETYADKRRELITDKAIIPTYGDPYSPGTVYLCTSDKEGNMVSYIQSNYLNEKESVYISATEKRCDGHIAIW